METHANIILASASLRRRQLLAEAGYKFDVVISKIDEASFSTENISPVEYAKQLAFAKANDVAQKYPDSIVIGADTVVDFAGQIIGKPADAKDAERITRMLFSRPHKVITGLALVCKGDAGFQPAQARPGLVARASSPCKSGQDGCAAKLPCDNKLQIVEADITTVFPKKLTEAQIAEHIKSEIWKDKAGAYAIQENSDPFVDHIDGSLSNVMGMPLELVKHILSEI